MQNAAQSALSNKVLAKSLMAQVAGEETRQLTARLIDTVLETKKPLRLGYRCDSPSMARHFALTIQPMKDDRALMVYDLRDAWHFAPPLNQWHYDPQAVDCKCSFCGDIRFQGAADWTPCDGIGDGHPVHVNYEICRACRDRIEAVVAGVLTTDHAAGDAADVGPSQAGSRQNGAAL